MQKLFENWRKFRKDILCEADLGPQYTPGEFRLERPPRPPDISREAWDEASRRCLAGESEYCPHKREVTARPPEEEMAPRARHDIESSPGIAPPVPVQWYPPQGTYNKLSSWCRRASKGSSIEAQIIGSEFVPILNNPEWNMRPDADRNGWCGNSDSVARHILAYRHGWPRAERDYPSVRNAYGEVSPTMTAKARLRSYESGKHPMSKERAPFLYDTEKAPNYKQVEKHMLRYPWYAEYLLDYFLQLREAQGGDVNKKPSGISKNRWKKYLGNN